MDRLSGELADRYLNYLESLMVDVTVEDGRYGFRCGFALRADHEMHATAIYADTGDTTDPTHLELVAAVVFTKLESLIDEAIAESGVAYN